MAPDPWGVASVEDAPASGAKDPWGVAAVDDAAPAPLSGPIGAAPVPAGLQGPPARGLASSPEEVLSTVGRHALNAVAGPVAAIGAPPQDTAEKVANMAMPGGLAAYRTLVKPVIAPAKRAVQQVGQGDFSGAARSAESAIPVVGPWADQIESDTANNGAVAGLAGLATDVLAPKAAAGAVSAIPSAAETTARGIVKQTFGLRGKDFARQADPAGAYLRNNIGPSRSMDSAAEATDDARSDAGEALGNAYAQADASGKLIPAGAVRKAIHPVIDDAKGKAGGPGVVADPAAYQALKDSFEPALQAADAKGGFTPSELWKIRRDMNESLNWGDQSRLNLTKTQQRVSGALGGVLEDAVPEVKDLNKNYQDLSKLHGRVAARAVSQPTLGQYAGKAALGAVGSVAGHAVGGPLGGIGSGIAAQAIDSVPVKTSLASGLYGAGRVLRPAARGLSSTTLPQTLSAVAVNQEDQQGNEEPENNAANDVQGSPSNESIAPISETVPDAGSDLGPQKGNQLQPPIQKGTPVTINGKPGKIVFLHQEMGIARVKTDDGRKLTVRLGALKITPHIQVAAHIRKVPAK